jgi:hypothetical protein
VAHFRGGLGAMRVVPLVALVAYAIHGRGGAASRGTADPAEVIVQALAAEGLESTAEEVQFLDPPPRNLAGVYAGGQRVVVRAHVKGEPNDVFVVRVRRAPEGGIIAVQGIYPLTRTADVDESRPIADLGEGGRVAFVSIGNDGTASGFELFDLGGEDPTTTLQWKKFQRFQNAVTNFQNTGSTKGFQRHRWALDPAPAAIAIQFLENGALEVFADKHRVLVPKGQDKPVEGEKYARVEAVVKGIPGDVVTWSVDRVRGVKWLGPQFIEFLEYYAFKWRDWAKRKGLIPSEDPPPMFAPSRPPGVPPVYSEPVIGWPPPPLKSNFSPAQKDEGEWISLDDDPFVGKNPSLPSPFVQTWVRTDKDRPYARVYVTVWDPRQVALHLVAGTVEPVSSTGEVGTGQIPRTPEVLKSLVAGFNGGFQAQHFDGGMQVDGHLYVSPRPYAGTIAELRDGSTAIGTWPVGKDEIPDDVLSIRQNLTTLVRDDVVNPYKQVRWGGTPQGWFDNIHTTRSGVCITKENFVAYFFGADMSPESLGRGMVAARCKEGVHLDMNAGHTGFEFYRVAPSGEFPDLGRTLEGGWEAEGSVPLLDGWSFRGRRMIKSMPHMNFPRYIGRDGRDFMYLTLRSVLPGNPIVPAIEPSEKDEGVWRVKGLPQHGFPYAIATTQVRPDKKNPAVHARIVKVDPRTVRALSAQDAEARADAASADANKGADTVLLFGGAPAPKKGEIALWLSGGSFAIANGSPGPSAVPLFAGVPAEGKALEDTSFLVGVTDDDGQLVMLVADAPDGAALRAMAKRLGCSQVMVAPKGLTPRIGGSLGLDGEVATARLYEPYVALGRGQAPSARELYPDTPIVEPKVWMPLQQKRYRSIKRPAGAAVPAPAPTSSAPPTPAPTGSAPQ